MFDVSNHKKEFESSKYDCQSMTQATILRLTGYRKYYLVLSLPNSFDDKSAAAMSTMVRTKTNKAKVDILRMVRALRRRHNRGIKLLLDDPLSTISG